ncbi:MAG: PQQ-binding-like beta-propeller repeat protein [Alphaproteobacteria bacterium]|nr:PQQ-binding-like beta-propeller repeat protein [Alphaproteobacteria bacterium]MCL2505508.1 PQQ-binding-like beta-propeller repeat protein [Alphaproteobacteria bacterium]
MLDLRKIFVFIFFSVFLAGCNADSNRIGALVKGERIAVIGQSGEINIDEAFEGKAFPLSKEILNLSWSQSGYDAAHVMPNVMASTAPKRIWRTSVGRGSDSGYKLIASPVFSKGRIFTIDARGMVSGIDAKDGRILWQASSAASDNRAMGAGLAVSGDMLYATNGAGDVVALDVESGKTKWRRSIAKPIRAAPSVADNRLFIISIDNKLYAFDATTGSIIWDLVGISESTTIMGASAPAVVLDSVVAAYSSGDVVSLRVQNGRIFWGYSLAGVSNRGAMPSISDIRALPVIEDGILYAVSSSGRMAAVNSRTGDRIWEIEIGGKDTVVISGENIFVNTNKSQLVALSKKDGRVIWAQNLQGKKNPKDASSDDIIWTGPVLAGGRLWLVNSLGHLASFFPQDGSLDYYQDIGEPLFIAPVVVDRTFYVLSDRGNLFALR